MKRILLCLLLVTAFSGNAFAAGMGKIEVQCPSKQCKIYVDNKYTASGTTIIKVKQGSHKIKVLENGKILINMVKFVGAGKYIAIKAISQNVATTVDEIMPEDLLLKPMTQESIAPVSVRSTSEAVTNKTTAQPATTDNLNEDKFTLNYYLQPGVRVEDAWVKGCTSLAGGAMFGWNRSMLFDISVSSFSGDNKLAVISEGTLGVSNIDLGLIYMMNGFYTGTGAGYYTFNHTVSDSMIAAKKAVNLDYKETIDGNFGFYCKGGYRFTALGINFDLGAKGTIVNTVATFTDKNTITLVENEDKENFGLPITTVYLGVIF